MFVALEFDNGHQLRSTCNKYRNFASQARRKLLVHGSLHDWGRREFLGDDLKTVAATFREVKRLEVTKIW